MRARCLAWKVKFTSTYAGGADRGCGIRSNQRTDDRDRSMDRVGGAREADPAIDASLQTMQHLQSKLLLLFFYVLFLSWFPRDQGR